MYVYVKFEVSPLHKDTAGALQHLQFLPLLHLMMIHK